MQNINTYTVLNFDYKRILLVSYFDPPEELKFNRKYFISFSSIQLDMKLALLGVIGMVTSFCWLLYLYSNSKIQSHFKLPKPRGNHMSK